MGGMRRLKRMVRYWQGSWTVHTARFLTKETVDKWKHKVLSYHRLFAWRWCFVRKIPPFLRIGHKLKQHSVRSKTRGDWSDVFSMLTVTWVTRFAALSRPLSRVRSGPWSRLVDQLTTSGNQQALARLEVRVRHFVEQLEGTGFAMVARVRGARESASAASTETCEGWDRVVMSRAKGGSMWSPDEEAKLRRRWGSLGN